MNSLLSTIARQIDAAKNHAGIEERRGEGAGSIAAILRSLRVTYLALSSGLDPWKDANHLFILRVSDRGEHELAQGGMPLPVDAPYLAYLFWTAGVDLVPGQILLVEPELAKDAIEVALGAVGLELAFTERERNRGQADPGEIEARANLLWDRKIELVAACLVADEYLERARALSEPEEAA